MARDANDILRERGVDGLRQEWDEATPGRVLNGGHAAPLFKPIDTFCAEYEPLAHTIEPIIRSSSINTLTARTGHGKTGFLVSASFAVAQPGKTFLAGPSKAVASRISRPKIPTTRG